MASTQTKLPVMQNIYYSNTVTMNKRPNHIPDGVGFKYENHDRLNKFQAKDSPRRLVADTFKASERNFKIPTTTSPLMMTSGVSPSDRVKEFNSTKERLSALTKKADFVLPNQGPTVLPLSGRGNTNLKLTSRHNSV